MNQDIPDWLPQSVFYQIYPPGFADANGDGIGDIPGIIEKLDYIRSLGANAIWIGPCFQSPFQDGGYDVSDYRAVHPRYGTMEDLVRLFNEAHSRNMRVILDFIPGHTSVEHPWFQESQKSAPNKYSNWYVWNESVWDATDGMEATRGMSERNARFVTNFFYFQPALNYGFENPNPKHNWQLPVSHPDVQALRSEMKDILRFWLEKGCDGFRVDMADSLVKNDPDKKGNIAFWREVRREVLSGYPEAVMVSEWNNPVQSIQAGFHMDFQLPFFPESRSLLRTRDHHRGWDFSTSFFYPDGKGDAREWVEKYRTAYERMREGGYISIPTGNHDIERIASGREKRDLLVLYTFIFTMPGIPFMYYGDEIGIGHRHDLPSKEGGYNRSAGRTPMQWTDGKNAGFSTAAPEDLYLPVMDDLSECNVAAQSKDPDSLLNHVKALLRLRKTHVALGSEAQLHFIHCERHGYPLAYLRREGGACYLVVVNPAGRAASLSFDGSPDGAEAVWTVGEVEWDASIRLEGRSAAVFKLPDADSSHREVLSS